MIRLVAVFTFLLIVGVCSFVVFNPGSYLSDHNTNPRKRVIAPVGRNH
jgi:hypothetical protein